MAHVQLASTINTDDAPTPSEPHVDLFADFWTLYPRHEAKKDAAKAWAHLTHSEQMAAVIAASAWRGVWRAQGREVHVIPLPATWLRGERWEDELPAGMNGRHSSHAPALVPHETIGRGTEMPEHVRAMLAKLRGKS